MSSIKKKSSRSVMGKLLPPVNITSKSQLGELDKRISIGPVTLVLIYADWCGHCQRFKPIMDKLEATPNRSVQVARVRDDMLPSSSIASIPNEGYPSLFLLNNQGKPYMFQDGTGEQKAVIPNHTDETKMTNLVSNAGTPQGLTLLNSGKPANEVANEVVNIEEISPATASNMSPLAGTAATAVPSIPKNIVADRLNPEQVSTLNSTLRNSQNALLSASTKPVVAQTGGGGSLWAAMSAAAQNIAPVGALFLGAAAVNRGRRQRKSTRRRRGRRVGTRKN